MINKKFCLIIFLGILLIGIMSAVGEVSYCCEQTTSGAWCQNALKEKCDEDYRKVPTSCESTSYCKLGCCYNSKEGTCMENTPQIVCQPPSKPKEEWGIWKDDADCDIPQCQLGCCLIGEQAAFVTQTRCKALSSMYGLKTNYRTDIRNEIECIASAVSDVKGACVFEKEYQKTCLLLTKKECREMGAGSQDSGVEFHEGYLCSAEELGTNCGPKGGTTCVEGEDEVFFLDTCGNLANIYWTGYGVPSDYWTKIYNKLESCQPYSSNGNAGSKTCGNCNYYAGSTCYGDYICRDLDCEDGHKHGETWCAEAKGVSKITIEGGVITKEGGDLPGGRYFRMVCYNGEISVEPCADFKQEVCVEDTVNGFSAASCRVNKWEDCYSQGNEQDCENRDKRDCRWMFSGIKNYSEDKEGYEDIDVCVPLYTPGFDFWNSEGDAEELCSLANFECIITYVEHLLGGEPEKEDCEEEGGNCYCLEDKWEKDMNDFCVSLGDCGNKKNYIGIFGYNKTDIIKTEEYEGDENEE